MNKLFSSNKKNVLNFDEPIHERPMLHEDDSDFDVVSTNSATQRNVDYIGMLRECMDRMQNKLDTSRFFAGSSGFTLPEYTAAGSMNYDIDALDGDVLVQAQGAVTVRGNKSKVMHVSALFRGGLIADIKV